MHTYHLRFSGFWFIATLLLAADPLLAAQKNTNTAAPKAGNIVKWVDEKGVTHYGDSLPPQYAGRDSAELNKQGRTVKRNDAAATQANKAAGEEVKISVEQKRHDSALLAAYTTEQEFDLARDRNLQTDEAAVEGLNQNLKSVKERLAASKKLADGFNQRKKPVPPYIAQDIKERQDEIAKIETQIAERQQSMEAIRQRFERDKQRFIQLKLDPNAPPPVETDPVAAPAAAPGVENAKPASTTAAPATLPVVPATEKPVATTAPMAAPKAPTAKLAPTAPAPEKPAVAPTAPIAAPPAAAKPAQPVVPVATKPISPAEKPTVATPAPAAAATKPVKKIKRVVMP